MNAPESTETLLPDRLKAGDILITRSGHKLEVIVTGDRDAFDQPLYRFRHLSGIAPNTLSTIRASRDQLQADGVRMFHKTTDDES